MNKRDDIRDLYSCVKVLDKAKQTLFSVNIFFGIASLIDNKYAVMIATAAQIISAILYFVADVADDGVTWYNAEKARRRNSIENGFDIRLSELETDGYYNNGLGPSVEKYALNSLESNYCSKYTAEKMMGASLAKSVAAILIFVIECNFIDDPRLSLIGIQAILSSQVFLDTIMLFLYKTKMDELYAEGYRMMISPGISENGRDAALLSYAVEYEAVKAHYKIHLSERIFMKNRNNLEEKWKQILSQRNIPG